MAGGRARWLRHLLAWTSSLVLVLCLAAIVLMQDVMHLPQEETVTVRKVDVAVPPPPEPPPPIKIQSVDADVTPTINLIGPGQGPSMTFAQHPKLAVASLPRVEQPNQQLRQLDLSKSLAVNFPLLDVKELDQIPRLLTTNRFSFPRSLRSKGVKRVETKVEIIIDQSGKAYVKKIIDPVYPEMTDVIRAAINDSKFTVPKKNGQPVQAVYLYTLVFINRL